MNRKRFIIEMGTGVDQHGQDMTEAATRAIKDAVARVCLIGLLELVELKDLDGMLVEVLVACPRPADVDTDEVLKALPFGRKEIKVVEGGMIVHGHQAASMGDKSDEIIVANAAVTVCVDADRAVIRS
ncbi:MAG: Lin0512 family protein [Dehalococcoidales bacterium]|nr:Lin0512 family protein [Dehalococcoidales bacterium]